MAAPGEVVQVSGVTLATLLADVSVARDGQCWAIYGRVLSAVSGVPAASPNASDSPAPSARVPQNQAVYYAVSDVVPVPSPHSSSRWYLTDSDLSVSLAQQGSTLLGWARLRRNSPGAASLRELGTHHALCQALGRPLLLLLLGESTSVSSAGAARSEDFRFLAEVPGGAGQMRQLETRVPNLVANSRTEYADFSAIGGPGGSMPEGLETAVLQMQGLHAATIDRAMTLL